MVAAATQLTPQLRLMEEEVPRHLQLPIVMTTLMQTLGLGVLKSPMVAVDTLRILQ